MTAPAPAPATARPESRLLRRFGYDDFKTRLA